MAKVITLMFHRVNDASLHFSPQQFANYLDYLVKHFPIVIPGQTLTHDPVGICLTFDDAYYDFYHDVYPLLKHYQIKALLAVPVKYITESSHVEPSIRLSVPYPQGMEPRYQHTNPFCTWQELREMNNSGQVIITSHGFSHQNLAHQPDLQQEIVTSKAILEQKLNTPIHHFIYPYGKMTRRVHQKVLQSYQYGLRIGGALNLNWNTTKLIYRVNADPLWTQQRPIDAALIRKWTVKYWLNRLRCK